MDGSGKEFLLSQFLNGKIRRGRGGEKKCEEV